MGLEFLLSIVHKIADLTFNLWYRLSEELLKQNDDKMFEVFKPYIQRLIILLCAHCQLDEDTSPVSITAILLLVFDCHDFV